MNEAPLLDADSAAVKLETKSECHQQWLGPRRQTPVSASPATRASSLFTKESLRPRWRQPTARRSCGRLSCAMTRPANGARGLGRVLHRHHRALHAGEDARADAAQRAMPPMLRRSIALDAGEPLLHILQTRRNTSATLKRINGQCGLGTFPTEPQRPPMSPDPVEPACAYRGRPWRVRRYLRHHRLEARCQLGVDPRRYSAFADYKVRRYSRGQGAAFGPEV